MNAEDFVSHFKREKETYLHDMFASEEALAGLQRKELAEALGSEEKLKELIDTVLTDTYYTILLALDGSAAIGGLQHTFKIYDEEKNLISDCGDIEAEAYEAFQENE